MKYKCVVCEKEYENSGRCSICGSVLEEVTENLKTPVLVAKDNPGIRRIEERCIKCGRCKFICQNQVGVKYDLLKAKEAVCLYCGQCVLNCPVASLTVNYSYKKISDYLNDTEKVMVAFTAPAVRVALGEEFGVEGNVEGKMVKALKELGFDYVLDTTFGADLTIMEEASELLERLKKKENLPQFTSCCPAWVRYLEIYHPNLINNLSTCKSPISMQGAIIKSYFSEMLEIPKENIVAVAITPCTSKKYEITLPNNRDTDFVVTTSELAMMIREKELDFANLEEAEFDSIMRRGSGGGVIFGNSGGVMEACIRNLYHLITGKDPDKNLLRFKEVRGYKNVKEATIKIEDYELNLLIIHGIVNIEDVLQKIENNEVHYDFIEVMNCPGGCVGGGGQPLGVVSKQQETAEKRIALLYEEDSDLKIRSCYQNQDIIDLYKSYLGEPLSKKSLELLHTKYVDRSDILGEEAP